jgi:hypothetical protein
VTANNKIVNNITNLLSTVNVVLAIPGPDSLLEIGRLKPINGSLVDLHVKKFVNGDGSIIKLAFGAKDTTFRDYTVYATYDQGSKKSGTIYANPLYFLYIIIYIIFAYAIVLIYFIIRNRKKGEKKFLKLITQEMFNVRKLVKNDPLSQEPFCGIWKQAQNKSYMLPPPVTKIKYLLGLITLSWLRDYVRRYAKSVYGVRKNEVISEINDYVRVDDFYSKLAERNDYIGAIDDTALKKLNKECLDLAEAALEKIDWSKYK